ncbi:DUF3667 domain-containing protein [Hwangdonia lutea]|uniref:DUF3667 domain-containing protein n=1 Tax=Hwangdonia lutea TaxID=3075823 RepID=A0AA97EK17_9FLAO|nr:DUF3667 domain-containing protein [Hwangdonia sp. SCSIO 19198]WOD42456.1 DUF3667 domain-containing protein [Hwangdonia sp. SCSIO 19198]
MNCKNCNTSLSSESDYCYVCGGKVIRNRLTFKNLFEHISETFFNYDNKLLKTFIALFTKPDDVIGGYINGTRKKYVNVISYFALAITITGFYLFVLKKYFPDTIDYSILSPAGQEEFQERNVSFVQENMSLFMMLYVPLYAIIARISFVGINKFNYTELLVVFLYLQAQMSIATALASILFSLFGIHQGVMSLILTPLMVLYTAICLKQLYGINTKSIILRTLLFFTVLMVLFVIVSVIMGIYMYLNGDFQQMIDAQKAAKGG